GEGPRPRQRQHRRPRARPPRRARRERAGPQPRDPGGTSMSDRPQQRSLFSADILRPAVIDSCRKLDPRRMVCNPVMFVVEIGALITTVIWVVQVFGGSAPGGNDPAWYTVTVAVWLWLTVLFGNFAEAIAEGRGKAQAAT